MNAAATAHAAAAIKFGVCSPRSMAAWVDLIA
jgi:hypothetical protein